MALSLRKIKEKNVVIDRGIGEATVTITLYEKRHDEMRTLVLSEDIKHFVLENNIEILGVLKNDSISNRYGEATGTWVFKIPTADPENSTTTILKRRKNKKKREIIIEEDWTKGPEK